ncbi:major capsid protein P2 [Synoicihabitans lomoniglobus]|uniref:Major capsid protein P2 n=1 Tax=Synoicihabitans lomoniglobus TaxID=2909285 RepID=A0AAF0I4I3_9BACT|nr:major capsid protein P2 [Opitutaceae bacterium LMO-M01]WED66853.1 major capsid protein P2 [Opitutaceae bacterium LMO-M01]
MRRNELRITGIEGVVDGGLATYSTPTGRRYFQHKLFCFHDGVATAAGTVVDRVRVKVDEVAIWDCTAQRLLDEAKLNGITVGTGELPLNFSDPAAADKDDESLTAWDTAGARTMSVELQLKTAGAVPRIEGIMSFDRGFRVGVDGKRIRAIIRKSESTINAPSGLYDWDTANKRFPILRFLMDGPQTINSVDVIADSERVWEVTKTQNARVLADYGLDATAFEYPLCFNFTEQIGDFLEVNQTLNVRIDSAAAQSITVLQTSVSPGFGA